MSRRDHVVALSGGIGGAKLALGLSRILPDTELTIIGNTGDDFEHLGLSISPDLDTLMYTLAGLDNPETGWGRRGESWNFMKALAALGGENWFQLGDGDLAAHVERTRRLQKGESLSAITGDFCRQLGIGPRVLPMSDEPVRTRLRTPEGWLDFQDYFVRRRAQPEVQEIMFEGVDKARAQPDFLAALTNPNLRAVIICPSNPFISVGPILAVPGVREALRTCDAPIIAVAPIIGGKAVKGPTAKMMRELGINVSAIEVARLYRDIIDIYLIDPADASASDMPDIRMVPANIMMTSLQDRENVAQTALATANELMGALP